MIRPMRTSFKAQQFLEIELDAMSPTELQKKLKHVEEMKNSIKPSLIRRYLVVLRNKVILEECVSSSTNGYCTASVLGRNFYSVFCSKQTLSRSCFLSRRDIAMFGFV